MQPPDNPGTKRAALAILHKLKIDPFSQQCSLVVGFAKISPYIAEALRDYQLYIRDFLGNNFHGRSTLCETGVNRVNNRDFIDNRVTTLPLKQKPVDQHFGTSWDRLIIVQAASMVYINREKNGTVNA